MSTYQDAYVFVRSAETAQDELQNPGGGVESTPFPSWPTGSYARLYVLKSDASKPVFDFLQSLGTFQVDKALAFESPFRIVHAGVFLYMAFVRVLLRGDADPRRVLQSISTFKTFKGGAQVQGSYDLLIEFGDDSELAAVQGDADAVRTVGGVRPGQSGSPPRVDLVPPPPGPGQPRAPAAPGGPRTRQPPSGLDRPTSRAGHTGEATAPG